MRLFQNDFRGYMTSSHKKNVDQLIIYPALLVFCLCVVQKALRYLRQRSGFFA